mmetsp:Transcript_5759/g.16315  ORF Transcript_5759/g.16315 Transcript_5759/m.16315 type:complete len:87 (+) Transcript_5759:3565-3825(+)
MRLRRLLANLCCFMSLSSCTHLPIQCPRPTQTQQRMTSPTIEPMTMPKIIPQSLHSLCESVLVELPLLWLRLELDEPPPLLMLPAM